MASTPCARWVSATPGDWWGAQCLCKLREPRVLRWSRLFCLCCLGRARMTIRWLERVCVLGAGGEGGDNLDREESELRVRTPGLQLYTQHAVTWDERLPPLDTNCLICKMGVVVDGPIAARGSDGCPGPGSSLSPDCLLGLTSPDWPPQISDTILLPLPSVLSFPQWPGPGSGSPPWRGRGELGRQWCWSGLGGGPPSPQLASRASSWSQHPLLPPS